MVVQSWSFNHDHGSSIMITQSWSWSLNHDHSIMIMVVQSWSLNHDHGSSIMIMVAQSWSLNHDHGSSIMITQSWSLNMFPFLTQRHETISDNSRYPLTHLEELAKSFLSQQTVRVRSYTSSQKYTLSKNSLESVLLNAGSCGPMLFIKGTPVWFSWAFM